MPYLVLGFALILGLGILGYWFATTDPRRIRSALKWIAITLAVGAALFFLFRGKFDILWYAGLFLLPALLRWRALKRHFQTMRRNAAGPSPGQSSSIRTEYLSMMLDHDSGTMDGEVTRGRFAGRPLGSMSLAELLDLLVECQDQDPQSAQVLEGYLDARHGDGWRDGGVGDGGGGGRSAAGDGGMTRAQALEILGLAEGASEAEIREAHRRLMLANHPDRGGSTFLAVQINRAKDLLLGT